MAVGATPGNVLALIFGQGLAPVAMGMGAGLAAAWASMRWLRSVQAGMAGDAAYVWMAAGLVAATAGAACWIPARRAARTEPNAALREE
jgi:putative ABC transport system permease protein